MAKGVTVGVGLGTKTPRLPGFSPPVGFVFLVDRNGFYFLDRQGHYILTRM